MHLVQTIPGEVSPICNFETLAGESIGAPRPPLNENEVVQLTSVLRDILNDEDKID